MEITKDIRSLLKDVTRKDQNFQRLDLDDIALGKLVDSCEHEANELMQLLEELQNPTSWQSFRKAIKNAREKGKVKGLEKRLLKLQKQIDFRLHVMMTYVLVTSVLVYIGLPSSNQQSTLYVRMNEISKEHTRMQLESVHHIEQLKADINSYSVRQANDSSRTQILIQKLDELREQAHRVANEERVLKTLEFDERKRRFNAISKAYTQTFNWILEDSVDLMYHIQASKIGSKVKAVSTGSQGKQGLENPRS